MSIHNSTVLTRNTPCLPEQKLLTFAHGTKITVRDLFGSMPVRVKHRALQAEKSSFTRDWDRLALDVVALLIAWPTAVSVSIRDAASRQALNLKVGSERRKWVNDSCRLFYQISLCNNPSASDWVPIGASSPTLAVSGFVSREPVATKRAQFISIGIEPFSNESRCNALYEEINKVFSDSSFGLIEDESRKKTMTGAFTQRELKPKKGVDRWPMFFLKITPTASSLGVDDIFDGGQPNLTVITDLLKAMFFEFLKRSNCRPRKVVLSAKSKPLNQQQYARPDDSSPSESSGKRQKNTGLSDPSVGGSGRGVHRPTLSDGKPDSPFATQSRLKSGIPLHTFVESAPSRSRTQSVSTTPGQRSRNSTPGCIADTSRATTPAEPSRPSLFDADGKLTRKPFDDIDPRDVLSSSITPKLNTVLTPTERSTTSPGLPPQDETIEWINPVTKMASMINSRTGFAMAPKSLTLSRRESEHKLREASCGTEERTQETRATTPWVADLIGKWKNPVFELTEPPIPKLPDAVETLGLEPVPAGHNCYHPQAALSMGTRHQTTAMGLRGRLSKDTLRKAQLIAQVDKKFIFARLPFDHVEDDAEDSLAASDSSTVLILIDQHAADERCRVEELMASYFKPSVDNNGGQVWKAAIEFLPKPVQFELSGQDKNLLREFQPYFAYWGICYDVEAPTSSKKNNKPIRGAKAKVSVHSLPPAIFERCRTDPRLLAELIRREAWRLKDEDRSSQAPLPRPVSPEGVDGDVPDWVSLFHLCPPGVLELINSRSCRSESNLSQLPFCFSSTY